MDWDRLSQAIIDRRAALGYRTREALAAAAGLSSRLLADLEKNRRQNYDRITIARVEGALEWEPGTVNRILRGLPYPGMPTEPVVEEVPAPVDASAEFRTPLGLLRWLTVPKIDLADLLHNSGLDPEQLYPLVAEHRRRQAEFDRQEEARLREEIRKAGGQVPDTNP